MKTVLITGASSGIGLTTAHYLHSKGYKVYGTSRKPGKVKSNLPFTLLELDVNQSYSIENCLVEFFKREENIDVLINNAGFAHLGFAEEYQENLAREQFETNFWGSVRMCKAVLPYMREHNSGRIIQISSLAGSVGVPMQSYYSASKHAIDGFCKSLRLEMKPFNVDIVLVKPGFIKTGLDESFLRGDQKLNDYKTLGEGIEMELKESLETGLPTRRVAYLVYKILNKTRTKAFYSLGSGAWWLPRLFQHCPDIFEWGSLRKFHIPSDNY